MNMKFHHRRFERTGKWITKWLLFTLVRFFFCQCLYNISARIRTGDSRIFGGQTTACHKDVVTTGECDHGEKPKSWMKPDIFMWVRKRHLTSMEGMIWRLWNRWGSLQLTSTPSQFPGYRLTYMYIPCQRKKKTKDLNIRLDSAQVTLSPIEKPGLVIFLSFIQNFFSLYYPLVPKMDCSACEHQLCAVIRIFKTTTLNEDWF